MVSLVGIILIAAGRWDQAVTIAIGLFSVPILYKLFTLWAVGLANPVVMTNLPIAILQAFTLSFILLRA